MSWVARVAWRDARKGWRRLLVYLSATTVGIAALVAAGSFRDNLQEAILRQAKPLLGADLVIRDRRPFDAAARAFFKTLPFPQSEEVRFSSMVFFPNNDVGKLSEVRGVDDAFPFYGEVATDPPGVIKEIFLGPSVLVEESVMAEFGLKIGDKVQLGKREFRMAGALSMVPGEAIASVFSAPRVFIARSRLEETGLVKSESLSSHRLYLKIPQEEDLQAALARIKGESDRRGWRVDTVAERQRSLGRRARNAERFLNLTALVMLILGGIGVASIMQSYARDKWAMAATLKCLGAPAAGALGVFVLQAAVLGIVGSLFGGALGVALQASLPPLLAKFVKVPIPFAFSWNAIISGVAIGAALSFLFTLLPLLALRSAPPLAAFRIGAEAFNKPGRDPLIIACALVIAALLFVFSLRQMPNAAAAAAVPAGVAAALAFLAWLTRAALTRLRDRTRTTLPFVWRQGLGGLFRPNNQTFLLVPVLGLGAALLFVISFSQDSLLRHLSMTSAGAEPNLALFDVQDDQRVDVERALRGAGKPVEASVPIVAMRLARVKEKTVEELRQDPSIPGWVLNRDYRSTYRDHLTPGEDLIAGEWPAKAADGATPISLEEELAEKLSVGVGDTIVFNVQGVEIETRVASLRKVDWFQLRPNFFAVFPEGVLDEAPKFHVLLTRAGSAQDSAQIQRLVRHEFPNVSMLDLRMVLATLDGYFTKVSFVLRFMGLFVLATGLLVLAGALLSTRFERIQEAALLRTLGAARGEIRLIHLIEYGLTGLFSGLAGLALGAIAAALLARYLFEVRFAPGWMAVPAGLGAIVAITMATGLLIGRDLLRRPPLETLREE